MTDFVTYGMTDSHILEILGKQFRQMRINARLSQEDLASASGLARKTISSIEAGKSTSTRNIVALLRSLRQLDLLSVLNAPIPVSPIAVALSGKSPQRVRSKKMSTKIKESEW